MGEEVAVVVVDFVGKNLWEGLLLHGLGANSKDCMLRPIAVAASSDLAAKKEGDLAKSRGEDARAIFLLEKK